MGGASRGRWVRSISHVERVSRPTSIARHTPASRRRSAPSFRLACERVFSGPTFDVVDERFADFMNTYSVVIYTLLALRAGWSQERRNVVRRARQRDGRAVRLRCQRAGHRGADAEVLSPDRTRCTASVEGRL